MAARAAFSSATRPGLKASTLLGAATLAALYPTSSPSRLEGAPAVPSPPSTSGTNAQSRLSIYDSPSAPIVLVAEPPSALQYQVSSLRKAGENVYGEAQSSIRAVSSKWVGIEKKVEGEVKSILPKDEQLSPGILYVGVSTLLGSILTRTRAFPLRFLAPPLFAIGSSTYFLPKTAHNLNLYIQELEKEYAPSVYEQHRLVADHAKLGLRRAQGYLQGLGAKTEQVAEEGRKKFEQTSGLTLQQSRKASSDLDRTERI